MLIGCCGKARVFGGWVGVEQVSGDWRLDGGVLVVAGWCWLGKVEDGDSPVVEDGDWEFLKHRSCINVWMIGKCGSR